MDDLTDLIELTDVPRLLPHRPNYATVFRWATRGIGPNRIRLAATRYGRRWYTDAASLKKFSEHLAAATLERMDATKPTAPTSKPKRTEAQLKRDLARAQREFDKPVHPCGSKCACAK